MKLSEEKNVKHRLESFLLFDYHGVEKHLCKMAQNGWKLEETGRYFWKYRKIEPADLKYAITYVPDASDWNPEPTDSQLTLEEYCAEAGWEKIGDWEQMQIFCSAADHPIPIDTDEALRLDVIKKSMKKTFIPAQISVLLCMLIFLVQQFALSFQPDPIEYLSQNHTLLLAAFMVYVTVANLMNLFSYFSWCRRSEAAAAEGGACAESPNYQLIQKITLVLTVLFVVAFTVTFMQESGNGAGAFMVLYLSIFAAVCVTVEQLRRWLKRSGVSKMTNWVVTILTAALLAFLLIGVTVFVSLQNNWLSEKPAAVYTAADGREYEIYRDEIPLTVQNLQDADHPNYSYRAQGGSSPLISHYDYRQHVWYTPGEQKLPSLDYEITEVNVQALYEFCLAEYLDDTDSKIIFGDTAGYYPADAAPWGADTVYQYHYEGDAANEWILCKDNRIVRLYASWPLDAEQMAIAGQKLLGEQRIK